MGVLKILFGHAWRTTRLAHPQLCIFQGCWVERKRAYYWLGTVDAKARFEWRQGAYAAAYHPGRISSYSNPPIGSEVDAQLGTCY